MVTEDYVSFETAKLLKEKGFNGYCRAYYKNYHIGLPEIYNSPQFIDNQSLFELGLGLSAPTLQMTTKWLRVIHGIDMSIEINDPLSTTRKYYVVIWGKDGESYILELFESWEIATEEAIKYCLENLI